MVLLLSGGMSCRSSTEDLFVSDASDSDATVDLSVPSNKVKANSSVLIVSSDSETDDKTSNDKSGIGLASVSASSVMQPSECKYQRRSIHTVSSSGSDSESELSVKEAIKKKNSCVQPECSSVSSSNCKEVSNSEKNRQSVSLSVSFPERDMNSIVADEKSNCVIEADVSFTQHKALQAEHKETSYQGAGDRPPCKYGQQCYRKNPEHLKTFWHPGLLF